MIKPLGTPTGRVLSEPEMQNLFRTTRKPRPLVVEMDFAELEKRTLAHYGLDAPPEEPEE